MHTNILILLIQSMMTSSYAAMSYNSSSRFARSRGVVINTLKSSIWMDTRRFSNNNINNINNNKRYRSNTNNNARTFVPKESSSFVLLQKELKINPASKSASVIVSNKFKLLYDDDSKNYNHKRVDTTKIKLNANNIVSRSSTALYGMFHVGDEVQVLNHNHNHNHNQRNNSHSPSYSYRDRDGVDVSSAATANANATDAVIGEVVEERGGGWYSVKVKSSGDVDSSVVIKQRGSGLSLLSSSQNISNKDGVTFSLADAYKKTKFGSNNMIGIDNVSQENVNDEVVVDQNNHAVLELSGNTNGMPSMKVTRNNNTSALLDLDMAMKMNKCSSLVDESLLAQCHNHASFHKWIVFTDLHVAPSTLDTCLEVLDFVHTSAQERGAGIIFLGDFWHHRGTVRIDCLNAVLNKLSTWNVPMIMIPGNHDQVTLGGR